MLSPEPAFFEDTAFSIEDIPLGDIFVGNRLRPVDPAWAEVMASSIEAGARVPPITVRRPDKREGIAEQFVLVIGGHRYEAHRVLGRHRIKAEIADYDAVRARLAEVQENLIRSELTPLDRAFFIAEHHRIWAILHPEAGRGGDRRSKAAINRQGLPIGQRRFSEDVAARCRLSERTIRDALRLAEALSPEAVSLLRGTEWARNGAELQRLAAEPHERQVRLATIHAQGGAETVARARIAAGDAPAGDTDHQEAVFRHLVSNWERAGKETRQRFLQHASLAEKATRERTPRVSEIIGDPRQIDLEEAIAANKRGRRS